MKKHNLNLSNRKYSEETLEKYINLFDIDDLVNLSSCQKLSEKFIEKHSNELIWSNICVFQKLSEKFIKKHSNKVSWNLISEYQILSEEFIEININKIDIDHLMDNKNIPKKIKKKSTY